MNPNSSEYEKSEYEPLPPDEKEIDRLLEEMAETAIPITVLISTAVKCM